MNPPQVQGLDQIIADLNPAYAPTENLLNQQRSGLGIKYDSQRSALGAEKVQGFNQINNQATGKGLSFSGIPADEQATYLSTKYLPGLQNLAAQQNQEDMTLQQQLAQIASERRLKAVDIRQGQQSVLEKFLADERDRQFQAQQAELSRRASAAAAASSRAAKADDTTPEQYAAAFYSGNYDQARGKTVKGAAESLIGKLVGNGLSAAEASKVAYNVRKQLYNE